VVVVFVILAVVVGVLSIRWHYARSADLVEEWAEREGHTLLEVDRRLLFKGPFLLRSGKGHEVFRVVVRTPEGATRSGYLRVGGWFLGLFSNQAHVEWD
jgi:hypothetical protein